MNAQADALEFDTANRQRGLSFQAVTPAGQASQMPEISTGHPAPFVNVTGEL